MGLLTIAGMSAYDPKRTSSQSLPTVRAFEKHGVRF